MNAHDLAKELLASVGITINGSNPWDIQVLEPRFYNRVIRGGSMALGKSYMDRDWRCDQLDEFFCRILAARLDQRFTLTPASIMAFLRTHFTNDQTPQKAFVVGEKHYDIGNDLYRRMLGSTMAYTCGYWPTAQTLDHAQAAKFELVCRKLNLQPGMSVLDIGCGWGSFAKYAAERYNVEVTGVTVSKEQVAYAREACHGLPVRIQLCDYRQMSGRHDRVVSLGMFEHVGRKNYGTYMRVVREHLASDGLFLLHTIGGQAHHEPDPWVEKYIFPNGVIPNRGRIIAASEDWVEEDMHNFGADYDRTLMAWHANFVRTWPEISAQYSERFYRMWTYWLLASAGSFRARNSQLWQFVFSPHGVPGGYRSVR